VVNGETREATEEEKVGRESGAVEWKRERGELGTKQRSELQPTPSPSPKTAEEVKAAVTRLFNQLTKGCSKSS
jgi:hypothetical protein